MECVNGDYGDFIQLLSEEAKKPQWNHCLESVKSTQNITKKVPLIKMFSILENDLKINLSVNEITNKSYNFPPTELMRLWILIGRCHMQILRDWVNIIKYI